MKFFYFLLLLFFICTISFAQTVLLLEDFSGAPQYTLPDMPEQIVSTTAYFTRTDGTNIASPIDFTDGETYFAVQNIDTSPMVSPATMLFDDIDITSFTNLTFGVALAEHDALDGNEDWDSADFVHFEYQIDNSGIWEDLIWVENDGSTFNSAPQIDTDFDGVGDGMVLINEFDEDANFDIPDTGGSLIDIRVTFGGLTSADEDIAIEVIYLVDNLNLFPFITLTSPTSDEVFPAGTTNVPFTYNITNTADQIDIDVNGTLTSDYMSGSPFNITTVDGESYTASVIIYLGGVIVSEESVDFSVDSPLGIDDNENNNFSIFPNPTSLGFVNIVSKNNETIKATVFDILGKQVIKSTVIDNKLDVSNLNTGVYIMRLTQNNATVTKKLVIK